MPDSWYNIQADLPKPLPPVLHPGTMKVFRAAHLSAPSNSHETSSIFSWSTCAMYLATFGLSLRAPCLRCVCALRARVSALFSYLQPVGPDDLALLFPPDLIMQEVSQERNIPIPDEVQKIYKQWRPSPLYRARALEKV